MILQRLAEHYERLQATGKVKLALPGWSQQKISFCIVLEADGKLVDIQDLRQLEGKSMRPRVMVVPGQSKPPGSGLNPCFLWDNTEYLLGWSADPAKAARAPKAFAESRQKHLALNGPDMPPAYAAVCAFLRDWSPTDAEPYAEKLAEIGSHFGVFRVAGEQRYVHELVDAPLSAGEQAEAEELAHCLVTGQPAVSARLHEPKIKGVAGAQTAGALLVSFNATAFESYGKGQGINAPVSVSTVFRYTNALNHLLDQRDRRIGLGDATIVFWADHDAAPLEDLMSDLFAGAAPVPDDTPGDAPKEDTQRVAQARLLMSQLRDGTRNALPKVIRANTRFFILGLSPNASRLSVRLWIEADAHELETKLGQHLRDLELRGARDDRALSVRRLADSTGRWIPKDKKFDTANVSPHLAGELARSVLTGAPYPQSFLATMVRRIRSDAYIGHERVSAIKACLIRNARLRHSNTPEDFVELDRQNTNVAYRCGRLFALLEKAQTDSAGGELNSTVKDRYFSSASATPALVFPRLFRLNNHHLAKLPIGQKIFYERQMGTAMTAPFEFPRQFSLTEQGRFIVGYFQQRQDLYTKKEKAPEENAHEQPN